VIGRHGRITEVVRSEFRFAKHSDKALAAMRPG
jgi:hypothetical protein